MGEEGVCCGFGWGFGGRGGGGWEFCKVLLGSKRVYRVLKGLEGFKRVVRGFTGL